MAKFKLGENIEKLRRVYEPAVTATTTATVDIKDLSINRNLNPTKLTTILYHLLFAFTVRLHDY